MATESGTGSGIGCTVIPFDYNNNNSTSNKNNFSVTPPSFNGDATQFLWWKSKM